MNTNEITVSTPQILLDPNLEFRTEEPLIRKLVVTKERCINPSLVDSFLRLLRNGSDDIIKQKLSSYSGSQLRSGNSFSKRFSCDDYLQNELYPNWQTRGEIINFCESQSKLLKEELDSGIGKTSNTDHKAEIDPRLDPYSARKNFYDQENAYKEWKRLETWIENNKKIESILQTTSVKTLKQNCDQNVDYIAAFFKFIDK